MSKAVYLFDSNARLLKKGSLTYDSDTLKYTFSATEAYITQGSIEVDELCIVLPDAMITKGDTGLFGSFVSPVRNPLGLIPGEWETRTIIDGAVETTYLNCAIFPLDLAYYTYVAGRYGFAIGLVDSTTGAIQKTPYDSYVVQNGIDNFTENNLTPSDYDNLLTAITNLTSTLGGGLSTAQDDINTLEATVIILEADKLEHSALVGITGETTSKNTPVYSKQKIDELYTIAMTNTNTHKARTDNPHSTTKAQVGLGNADNTSDVNKPVSTDQAAAIALKLSKDLSVLTDGGQIASNDLIYVYTNDGVPTKVAGSELTQLITTITMNPSTYVLTIKKYDGTQTTIDLPAEMAFVSASYSDVTQDLTFTLQNGTTVAVPLDDLVGGLASEDWVALNFYDKTETDAKYEVLTNKATDFSVVNDTKYPTVKAVDERTFDKELLTFTLPNGVKDYVKCENNSYYYVQRVKKYVLQSADIISVFDTTKVTYGRVNITTLTGCIPFVNDALGKLFIQNKTEVAVSTFDNVANIGKYFAFVSTIDFVGFVLTLGTTLASARTALAGTVIYYQLATPIETEITDIKTANWLFNYDKLGENSVEFINLDTELKARVNPEYNDSKKYPDSLNKPFNFTNNNLITFGDSIAAGVANEGSGNYSAGVNSYINLFKTKFNMTITNLATGGSCLTKNDSWAIKSIYEELTTHAFPNTVNDFIIIAGGTNDYSLGRNLGSYESSDPYTIYGALRGICSYLQTNSPNSTVIFITPINTTEIYPNSILPLNAYRNAIYEIATEYKLNVVDGSTLGFPDRVTDWGYKFIVDGVHPTLLGHYHYFKNLCGRVL